MSPPIAGLVWVEAALEQFLTAPTTFVPGARMGYAGVTGDQEGADPVAFLRQATARTGATDNK